MKKEYLRLIVFISTCYGLLSLTLLCDDLYTQDGFIIVPYVFLIGYIFSIFQFVLMPFAREHRCKLDKPIISRYVSFNVRDIVYECKCGKRTIHRIYRPFHIDFPIETTPYVTKKDLEKIANEKTN